MGFSRQRFLSAAAMTAVLLVVLPLTAQSASIEHTFSFDRSDLSVRSVNGREVVSLRDALQTVEEGRPELPLVVATFAVPDGMEAVGASVSYDHVLPIKGVFAVSPVQPQVPLSYAGPMPVSPRDEAVYSSAAPYPSGVVVFAGNGNMGGQRVANVFVYPVSYVPSEGRLELHDEISVTLSLVPAANSIRKPGGDSSRSLDARQARARSIVVNPSDVSIASGGGPTRDGAAEYLIITDSSYVSLFQPLADWKSMKGVPAEIVSTSWIYSNYAGIDNQQRIRNCIIDYYQNHGTTWVLLGGDTDIVPDRIAFAKNGDSGDDLRCDLYYADLDGSWDDDGDGVWGEVYQDNIDMYADVFVGRAPVNTASEVTRFVERTLTYEGTSSGNPLPTDYQLNMLFMAEVLWDSPWTDHAVCKNMIDDDSVPARFDPITKLYQTNGLLTKTNVISNINAGSNIINHNGHANWNVMSIGSSALYRSDFDNLTNGSRYGIMYSIGCWAAAIDYDCMAEHWVNAPNGGGVAFVGNTRYGWGTPGDPGEGTSDLFDREFFNQLFNEGNEQIGVTTAAHKDAFVSLARTMSYYRFCLYELVLLGDPELRIWTDAPDISANVSRPSSLTLGDQKFVVTVSVDGRPLEGALALLSNAEIYESATTGADGVAVLEPSPGIESDIALTVTGPGMSPHRETLQVVDQTPDTDAPSTVSTLVVADPFDTGSAIDLDWTGYTPPADFACYEIYREDHPFSDVSALTPTADRIIDPGLTSWTDASVADGDAYYYSVVAMDLAGNRTSEVAVRGPVAASNNARILIWDADDGDLPFDGMNDDFTSSDGSEVPWEQALSSIGELYSIAAELPADLSPFDLVVYLGGVMNFGDGALNIRMTDEEAAALTDFIDGGGSVYVEEPSFGTLYDGGGTPATIELWERFHSVYDAGVARTTGNVQSVSGSGGSPMDGMSFAYDYQSWPDQFVTQVSPDGTPGSSAILVDQDGKNRGSAYLDGSTGSHVFMVPVLLGGMSDGASPSTREEYVSRLLDEANLLGTSGVNGAVAGPVHVLDQNVPNPFNPETSIRFTVGAGADRVTLSVYDVAGRLVARLLDGHPGAGEHVVTWNGRDDRGREVASGIYFARLSVGSWSDSRKMALLK